MYTHISLIIFFYLIQQLMHSKTNKIYYKMTDSTHCFVQENVILANVKSTKKSAKCTNCYLKC